MLEICVWFYSHHVFLFVPCFLFLPCFLVIIKRNTSKPGNAAGTEKAFLVISQKRTLCSLKTTVFKPWETYYKFVVETVHCLVRSVYSTLIFWDMVNNIVRSKYIFVENNKTEILFSNYILFSYFEDGLWKISPNM